MITDLRRTKYNTDGTPDKCEWWTWTETCDDCGIIIFLVDEMLSTSKPKDNKKQYCLNCLNERLDKSD